MNTITLGSQFGCKSLDFIIEEIHQDMDGTSITVRVPTITDIIKANIYEGREFKEYCDNDVRLTADVINSRRFSIDKVIFNDPATIILWKDGTKTVVKCSENDTYDPEKGMAMAIAKKALGNKGNYCNVFKKWLPEEEEYNPYWSLTEAVAEWRRSIYELFGIKPKEEDDDDSNRRSYGYSKLAYATRHSRRSHQLSKTPRTLLYRR